MILFAGEESIDGGLILSVVKQTPTVGALLVMIWYFLRFLREESDRREKMDTLRSQALATLGSNCHEFQRDMAATTKGVLDRVVKSMDRNTEALGANTQMMERVTDLIDRGETDRAHLQKNEP